MPGCGHIITRYDVRKEADETGAFVAVVRCPSCSFVVRILPWAIYIDNMQTPLLP